MKPTTIVLAEDHTVVREGLRLLLKLEQDLVVVGEADTGRKAVAMVEKLRPAVVVMDLGMPELNGMEATRQIRKTAPDTKVLILSAYGDEDYVEQAMAAGASAYLIKQSSARVLSEAIREVCQGKTYFSPSIARRARHSRDLAMERGRTPSSAGKTLSSREVEVLQLIAEGKANKQVAAELGISVKTVEKHRQRLMEKLGIHNTAGLTRYAIRTRIVEGADRGLDLKVQ